MSVTRLICPHQCDDCKDEDGATVSVNQCIHGFPLTVFCESCATGRDVRTMYRDFRIFTMPDTPRIVGLTESDDTPPRGVPAYHPTEYQPIRVGGPET